MSPGGGRATRPGGCYRSWFPAVLLYYALRGVDWAAVWRTVAAAQWGYLAAAAMITIRLLFSSLAALAHSAECRRRFRVATVFWANMAGYLGNNFLPARAGELLRSFLISSRSSLSNTYVLTTALSERLMDVIALVLGASLVLLRVDPKPALDGRPFPYHGDCGRRRRHRHHGAAAYRRPAGNILTRIPMPAGLRKTLMRLAEQILLGMRAFHDWGRFAGFVFLTLIIWAADSTGAIVAARGLGLHFSFGVALLLLTGLGLGSALPSTPGYVGIYQFVAVTVLTPFGISRDAALAYILVVQVSGYLVVTLFGLPGLYLLQGGSLSTRK